MSIQRSYLFVPGSQPERFDKALKSGADVVIIDLEDAVALEEKDRARSAIASWAESAKPFFVRVNAKGSHWYENDIRLAGLPGVRGLILPKAETAGDVSDLFSRSNGTPIYPLIESAQGMANAADIASSPGVVQLIFGTLDFMVDMGIDVSNHELNQYRSRLTMTSKIAGIKAPIDGVTTAINDITVLEADAGNGKRWGFAGKLCIHPSQVATVNEIFSATEAEVEWATRVLDAARRSSGAAVAMDGKMVDRPVILRAERIMEQMSSDAQKAD